MALNKTYKTKEEVQAVAKSLIGKTFGEVKGTSIDDSQFNKGSFGHIIEEEGFEYGKNSRPAPDFEEAGIELKTTPYKINKNGTLSAKERLVLNIINYMEEYKKTFHTSDFWKKNNTLEIIWYKWEIYTPKEDLMLTHELLFTFPEDDLKIIEADWKCIIDKIKQGKAHEISEADTMYLGACTKGVNANTTRKQPFSTIEAKQRAYCLKTSYMTQLVRQYIGGEVPERIESLKANQTFEEKIVSMVKKYSGRYTKDLCKLFNVNPLAKNVNEVLISRMLGVNGKVGYTDQFLKANIVPKTIRVTKTNTIKESMSFPAFKFCELVNESWETSNLFTYFSTTKFMFVVFREDEKGYYFDHIKFWNMPLSTLENEVYNTWSETIEVLNSGNIVREITSKGRVTNFTKMTSNGVCHIRPHGRNANDTYKLPVPDVLTGATEYTKQCFWLNSSYVLKIIS